MPTWLVIVLVAIVALVLLLAIGGAIARRRQLDATRERFEANLAQVNQDLAAAHAQDRGWARAGLEAAARSAYAAQRDGADARELTLIQIVDRPGTDDDKAVFRVSSGGRDERLRLGRQGGEWVFEELA